MYRLPKKVQSTVLVAKCCKFAASAKKHIKPVFAAPTSKGYTKLVSTYGKYQIVPCSQVQVAKKLNALFLEPKKDQNRYTAVFL